MKRRMKAIAVVLCMVLLLGMSTMAASSAGEYHFRFYSGEGRTINSSAVATKANRNTYMYFTVASLSGSRTGMAVFGSLDGSTTPMTTVANPPLAGKSMNLSYTKVIGVGENARLYGYTDTRTACSLDGSFTP